MFDLLVLAGYDSFQIGDIFFQLSEQQSFLRDVRVHLVNVFNLFVDLRLEAPGYFLDLRHRSAAQFREFSVLYLQFLVQFVQLRGGLLFRSD